MLIPATKSLLLKRLARVASFLTGTLRKLFALRRLTRLNRGTVYELLKLILLIVVIAFGFIAMAYLIIWVT